MIIDYRQRTGYGQAAILQSSPAPDAVGVVYGPGHYRFRDFLKVGAPLTLLIFGIAMALVPRIWPLVS